LPLSLLFTLNPLPTQSIQCTMILNYSICPIPSHTTSSISDRISINISSVSCLISSAIPYKILPNAIQFFLFLRNYYISPFRVRRLLLNSLSLRSYLASLTLSDPMSDHPTLWFSCSRRFSWSLTLSNPIFLPPAYSPTLIYFGRERGWWVTCNYPTVLKEKNINRDRKSTTCAICWLKSVLRPTLWFSCSRRFSSCSTDFIQQIAQVVLFLFLFMFFSFKTVG
jgi:hypothetical protein